MVKSKGKKRYNVHPRKGPEGNRNFALLTKWGGGMSTPRPGRFTFGKETRHPFYRRLCGPQGRVGRERKISPPTGIRSPDLPACSESLYRLRYPGLRSSITFLYSTQLQFIWYALLAHLRHAPCNVDLNSLHSLTLTSSQ